MIGVRLCDGRHEQVSAEERGRCDQRVRYDVLPDSVLGLDIREALEAVSHDDTTGKLKDGIQECVDQPFSLNKLRENIVSDRDLNWRSNKYY